MPGPYAWGARHKSGDQAAILASLMHRVHAQKPRPAERLRFAALAGLLKKGASPGRRPSNSQAHPVLETSCLFRLILYWNQTPIPGSFHDWKMLRQMMQTDSHRLGCEIRDQIGLGVVDLSQ